MSKARILVQLDGDNHASVFDRVVAVDAGVDHLFSYSSVTPGDIQGLVHGGMFTRGPSDLKSTAFFIGGSNVAHAERLLEAVQNTFFGPIRCSVLLDANGANTTASGAVLCAKRHLDLSNTNALVLGGTGPVGQRVALLLAKQGAKLWVGSRKLEKAAATCDEIRLKHADVQLNPFELSGPESVQELPLHLIVAAGAAGVQLASKDHLKDQKDLKVLIDLNAVPPAGIDGVDAMDQGTEREGVLHYGAIGVGNTKMKIHKAAIQKLFESNDQVLDAEAVFDIGLSLEN